MPPPSPSGAPAPLQVQPEGKVREKSSSLQSLEARDDEKSPRSLILDAECKQREIDTPSSQDLGEYGSGVLLGKESLATRPADQKTSLNNLGMEQPSWTGPHRYGGPFQSEWTQQQL